ncbi:ATP-binding cassette domain-containing protein [Micromonospora sp. WMMD987]|jgi:ABC-2 type transport system ATP-binding protein|uniref:ATP-binding cassette domain-containing protein n=1 Tax=Micromonospora sp. WMMD987 TaxID=3016089 RepID=UPI00249CC1EC|nr:ATP-binding cassette domain-containing protein [Micromonospora sp. WMMD987]WFE95309.1 ATP-binding cassette domain-containing protein [Micromonospora sp. WMMD987]
MKGSPLISAKQLGQGYGSRIVFRALDLELQPGVTALLGPNGAGKTTLLQTLATVLPPRQGQLTIDGRVVVSEADARLARRRIGFLPQQFGYEPGMRVRDFVQYGAWIRGLPTREWAEASTIALEYVGLADEAASKMGRLSGGMRQRAAIAWAIVGKPDFVVLDEPTVGLDPQQRLRFRDIIVGLDDTTVLLSTHLIDDVDAICDRVVIMHEGRICFEGLTEDLKALDDPSIPGYTPLERAYMSLLPQEGSNR